MCLIFLFQQFFDLNNIFFRKWGRWQIEQLRQADHFFVQNQSSADLLQKHGIEQVTLSGDTRFDRVHNIAKQKKGFSHQLKFLKGGKAKSF